MSTVVFFHAHPDDEAIFTGGTIARLVASGGRAVVVVATCGEQGSAHDGDHLLGDCSLGDQRAEETRRACGILGVHRLELLGYTDSGIVAPGEPLPPDAFAMADVDEAATRLAAVLLHERADALVFYDEGGIYGHADHLAVHRVGRRAAALAATPTVYESTVDHEYLHFVETHLVGLAALAVHEEVPAGVPTVLISTTIDVSSVIGAKRAAMAAHASQIPASSAVMALDATTFAGVYGYEWYIRTGPPGPLDTLSM